jgi:hypothetical protein
MKVGFGLFGGYLILIYNLIMLCYLLPINLAWIQAIELTKKQKDISKMILFLIIIIIILLFNLKKTNQ